MPEYVSVPIETEPDAIAEIAFDYLESRLPDWTPAEPNLDVWILSAVARMAAETRDIASDVPAAIFRYFGAQILGLPPNDAVPASGLSTWNMVDNAGYTVDAGSVIGLRNADGTLIGFEVLNDIVIPPLSTTAIDVEVVAVEDGVIGNSLSNPVEMISSLDFVQSVSMQAPTSGGLDEESDDDYLSRLIIQARLMAPRPVVPRDFADMSLSVEGIARATAIDLYNPGIDEVQQVILSGATGGTITLTFEGQTTAGIAVTANAATIANALIALSNVGPSDVIVSGGPLGTAPVFVQFTSALGFSNRTQMTGSPASATGTPVLSIGTTREGAVAVANSARSISVALADSTGLPVTPTVKTALSTFFQALREINFIVGVIDATYTTIAVTFTATAASNYVASDVQTRAIEAVNDYLNPANFGLPQGGDQETWTNKKTISQYELATVLNNVEGLDEVTSLLFGIQGGAMGTTTINLSGTAPLPLAGTISGTVV